MKQVKFKTSLRMLTLFFGLLLSMGAFAQTALQGHVKDASGEPIIGATIRIVGVEGGTVTDFDGNFTITAKPGTPITVGYLGYKTAEVKAQDGMVVVLEEEATSLSDVIVIGYGTAKKDDLTGSVTAIKPDEMNHGLNTNAQDMITGKIAGVSVISGGGTPGGSATIRIRGGSSLSAQNDPLIVIDGLAMDNDGVKGLANPLSMVNPNDIESFTVLKDASATAIYGSRASNGVIIITTKKGRAGAKPRVSYDGNISMSNVKKTLDVMDGDEYRAFIEKIWGGTDNEAYKTLGTANTDWQDQIYRTAISTDHNITLSGGLKNMPYRVSLGYTNQSGIIKTSNFQRYTASVNVAPSFLEDHLKINVNAKAMYAKNRYADGGVVGSAAFYDPTQPVYSDSEIHKNYFGGYQQWYIPSAVDGSNTLGDSSWAYYKNSQAAFNPLATLEQKDDRATSKALIGNLEIDYKVQGFEDLRLHASAGMDLSTGKQETTWSPFSGQNNYYGNIGYDQIDKYNLSLNMYLQYTKDFNDNNHFDIMGGYEWQHFHREGDKYYAGYYPSTTMLKDPLTGESLAGQPYSPSSGQTATESYLVSLFGRANYTLLNRYMLTGTVRYDGSSRFAPGHHFGLFPSVAFAWRINEEKFLRDLMWLSDLKLRLGYGITGQQNLGQGDYPALATFIENKDYAYYPILGNGMTYRPGAYNKELKWEETTTYNVGLDFGFLRGRISGSVDYYYRETNDLINFVNVAAGTNFKNMVLSNVGSLKNSGVEASLNLKVIQLKDWRWELGYNVTYNKNEITKLTTGEGEGYYIATGGISSGVGNTIQAHAVGHPASSFLVYQQVYDVNGKPIENEFVDRDGNGVINDKDRYFYKKPTADVMMGLTSKLMYKNWDLGFSLRASLNNYVYNDVEAGNSDCKATKVFTFGALNNRPTMVLDNNFQGIGNYYMSDMFVQNASFLKCDNITLGYSFEKLFGKAISGRLYATVQNVFTITNYKGLDPEIDGGIDNNIYPRPMTSIVGLSLNF